MYLEPLLGGSGDIVSRLIMGMTRLTTGIIGVIGINLRTKSPDPPSRVH